MGQVAKLLAPVCMVFVVTGCATIQRTVVPNMEAFDVPPINTRAISELGDTVVSKGKLYSYDGIELLNQVEAGDGVLILKFTIPAQKLAAKTEDDQWTYYFAENATSYDSLLGVRPVIAGLKISKTEDGKVALFGNSTSVTFTPQPPPKYVHTKILAVDKSSFRQELIYNGRAGNFVKFLYRELSNDLMRGSFSQEVQYDLSDGKLIGFKGVRLEIIEANNTQLIYKLLKNFPDNL